MVSTRKSNKLPRLSGEIGGDFLPLVQVVLHAVHLLIGLVDLTGQHHRVPRPGQLEGPPDGGATVGLHHDLRRSPLQAGQNVVDNVHGHLSTGIV